jgi:cellobiose phosphorylase
MRSRWASLISSEPGIDPYAFAVSDPYQDGVGQGIFTGKGIFDVDVFAEVLCDRIPENRVLSHDLLEGGFLRAGLLSDIELIDDQPATFRAFQKRLHRWVRGDWQLIIWLFPHAENRRGERTPVDLGGITRWQMIDNLRRSLSVPVMFVLLLLGLTVLPGSPMRWLALLAATLFMPLFFRILSIPGWMARPQRLLLTAGQAAVTVLTLPYQSAVLADAIVRTLYRLTVSKKRLLEWVSSAEVERASRAERQSPVQGLYGGAILIVLFVLATSAQFDLTVRWIGFVIGVFWAVAPLAIAWLDQPVFKARTAAGASEQRELRKLAEEIWAFFETYVTSKDNWLPPDNVQLEPPKGVAHRTSPTNIGLYLACTVAARDFGFIDTPGMIERIERTLSTIERMEKWKGHLYNWYETTTLKPLHPVYVSTVDSGNLASYLIAVKEGVAEWVRTDFPAGTEGEGRTASPMNAGRELNVAFAEELTVADVNKGNSDRGEGGWATRGQDLIARLEKLITNMDFRPLYDHKAKLFSLGYYVSQNERDRILYDFIASEARQASFVAIALGQVSVAHWHALGRTMTKVGKHPAFLSWSGTMFEYLMPMLVMRHYPKTVWDSTYRAVVNRQIGYARERGVPYGISESGYYAFDYEMNYQYRAFGVPGLGFKRGLEQDLVVAPYATVMSLPFAMREGMETLRRLERDYGARGEYGFYEAIDFTSGHVPENRKFMVIKSYMAHHQGMSLLTLSNLLLPQTMPERFHRDKRVQAAELLLQERLPDNPKIIRHPALASVFRRETERNPHHHAVHREYKGADTRTPQVCLLSNGSFSTVITNSGGGFSMYEDLAVTRWREDPILDEWGSYLYIRDTDSDSLWSPTHNPCRIPPDEEQVRFMPDRAFFRRRHGDTETILEICVSPEYNAEVRRLTIVNNGTQTKQLEITTYCEPVLAQPAADEAHPAFSKLFILTEYEPAAECLLAKRKPRQESDRPRWAVHALIASDQAVGPLEYETDRAAFIGRGHRLADPRGIRGKLNGTVGSVADPAFVMRRRVTVEPGNRVQLFAITGAAETREEAVNLISRFRADESVENTFRLAWNRSQIELRHLQLTAAEANVFQMLSGYLLYTPPFSRERAESVAANLFGQSRLWAHGISGDRPVVVAHIEDRSGMPLAVKLIKGHEYLRRRGLRFDLVLINESAGGYLEDLQKRLQHAVEHSVDRYGAPPDGIYIVKAEQLSEEDLNLLYAVSRAVLHTNGPSLLSQFKLPRERKQLPEPFVPSAPAERFPREDLPENGELLFFNGYGGFSPDGKEYRIQVKPNGHLPSPWINVLANPAFGTIVSELGTGYSWWRNSRECKLTPWSNDPVLDRPGEVCYLRDEESGEVWTPAPAILDVREPYLVSHGRGYTRFWHSRHGIVQEMTVSVPLEDPVKVIQLRLRNQTKMTRKLTVTYYAEWVLGVKRQETAPYIVTEWDSDARILLARNMYQETFRDATAFIGVYPQNAATGKSEDDRFEIGHAGLSWTGDRSEFLGRNGSYDRPAALGRMKLSGSTGAFYEPAGAVQALVELKPGEETDVSIVLGCADSRDAAARLARKYSGKKECDRALEAVKTFWEGVLGQIQVTTPDPDTDVLLNGWLLYQTLCCRMWARTAFYQAGGAFGFRDQLQDSLALLHTRPDLTRAQIVLHASHQYKEGDVQHWWHEETERGIRTRFSDDLLWLPYAVGRYIAHTQDESVLEETAPFLHSEPLGENEHERYEVTRLSGESGTIYEHCLRAIDRALSLYGEHGLPLIGIGDWNDGMSNLGAKGRGESVWLGWFLGVILEQFAGICAKKGDRERAERYLQARQETFAAINEHGWDGQWYRRAFSDAGQWMGSIHNAECRIDAIAQSWSVISGGAPKERQLTAMNAFDRELVDRNLSVVSLLTPPFEKTEPSPGYIQGYPPGIRENGGQYTHGVIWSITAWSLLGEGDKAYELFRMLNPVNHARTPNEARRYAREPYAVAADVYTSEPHKGHAGWTWYTGAAGWLYQAGIESILGVRRSGSQLLLKPCIPAEWPGYTVKYRHGRSVYWIEVQNPHHKSAADEQSSLQADEGSSVVSVQGDAGGKAGESGFELRIPLEDDGKEHRIILVL